VGPAAPTISSVAFNATNTALQGPYNGNNVLNTVPFNSITSSTGGGFSTSTGIYTVPTGGYYQFNGAVGITNYTDTPAFYVNLILFKNGQQTITNSGPVLPKATLTGLTLTINVSQVVLCAAGDTLNLATLGGIPGSYYLSANSSYFSGFLTANGQVGPTGATGPAGTTTTPTVFTNTNTAGGTGIYYTVGGVKYCTGETVTLTSPAFNATPAAFLITWPAGFFTTISSYVVTISRVGGVSIQYCSGDTFDVTSGRFYVQTSINTAGSCRVSWTAIGT
jgi:hypothetical protein